MTRIASDEATSDFVTNVVAVNGPLHSSMSALSVGRLPNLFFHFLSDLLFIDDDDPRAAEARDFTD